MNKSVEITVLVELFSTFFEKITLTHPNKDVLMKQLSKFKSFLYSNQENLEKGYEFLQQLRYQMKPQTGSSQKQSSESKKQQDLDLCAYDPNQLSEKHFKLHKLAEFPGLNLNQVSLISNKFTYIREFVSDVNSSYRCIAFKYFETLLRDKNESKIHDLIQNVQNKKIEMHSYFMDDEISRESIKKKFCGYFKHLQKQLMENQPFQHLSETLYRMVNNDNIFDASLVSFVKESSIKFINESDPLYIKFIMQNHEMKDVNELINLIRSSQDPQDIVFKLVAGTLEMNLNLHIADNEQNYVERNFKVNIIAKNDNTHQINLLKVQNPYSIFHLLYQHNEIPQQDNHKKLSYQHSSSALKYTGSFVESQQENFQIKNTIENFDENDKVSPKISRSHPVKEKKHNKENNSSNIVNNDQENIRNNYEQNPTEDLKIKASYIIKMLKFFDSNTDELIQKLSTFKDGRQDEEEEEKDEENIERILKEQINGSKSRTLNFYSSLAPKDSYEKSDKLLNEHGYQGQFQSTALGYSKQGLIEDNKSSNTGIKNILEQQNYFEKNLSQAYK